MKKKLILAAVTAALAAVMAVSASAEYVACADGYDAHDFGEWSLKESFSDGNTLSERVCARCGYIQKGYGRTDDADNSHMAVTMSLEADIAQAPAFNPATGAEA